jgi:hypothetical protein
MHDHRLTSSEHTCMAAQRHSQDISIVTCMQHMLPRMKRLLPHFEYRDCCGIFWDVCSTYGTAQFVQSEDVQCRGTRQLPSCLVCA